MMQHKIYLVRHGQSKANVTGERLSAEEDVLTDLGRKQAAALGEQIKHIPFTRAYSSNYQRANETAKEILAKNDTSSALEVNQDARIRERDLGNLDFITSINEIIPKIFKKLQEGHKLSEMEVPGGESLADYVGRIDSFFTEVILSMEKSDKPETCLIVSHGLVIRRFLSSLKDESLGNFCSCCDISNWTKDCYRVVRNTDCTTISVCFEEGKGSTSSKRAVVSLEEVLSNKHLVPLMEVDGVDHGAILPTTFSMTKEEMQAIMKGVANLPASAKEELVGCNII